MQKPNTAQLSLLDVDSHRATARARRPRHMRLAPEVTAMHCRALMAEIDRARQASEAKAKPIALAPSSTLPRPARPAPHSAADEARAVHLAQVFEAIERGQAQLGAMTRRAENDFERTSA